MASASHINLSLLFILAASMAMLAASSNVNTIQTQTSYNNKIDLATFEQCYSSVSECYDEILIFFRALARGLSLDTDYNIAPSCCSAVMDLHQKCWILLFPDPFYNFELRTFCARQTQGPASAPAPVAAAPAMSA